MKQSIPRHYQLYVGGIACGITSTKIDATRVPEGVSCKRCKRWLIKLGLLPKAEEEGKEEWH